MRKALLSVHISDIHFGALDPKQLMFELENEFFDRLSKLPRIDFVTINGDSFHYDLSLNSSHTYYAFKFFDKLFKICKQKNCSKVRIIKGTKSHDHDQLTNLTLPEDLDVKIITKVTDEELFKDFNILYIPEEYMKDKDRYYKVYFEEDNKYNMICGHGMIDKVAFSKFNSEINMESAPIFDSKELMRICKGPILFGHIHDAVYFYNKIFYTGSFSRWCQGEEKPKGFIINIYDLQTDNFKIIPCKNNLARRYVTRTFDKIVETNDSKACIQLIERIVKEKDIYKFKIIINENNDPLFMGKVLTIQNYFSNNKLIEFNIKSINIDKDDTNNELLHKYNYLLDEDIPKEIKISKFMKDKMEYNLSPERIEKLLTMDILNLINKEDNNK